jgi:choline-sulfatase
VARLGSSLLLALWAAWGAGCSTASAPPPSPRPLSIVLVTIDTLRADRLRPSTMPALDRLARESVVFAQTVSVAPLTLPAHASILTGLYPPRHGVRDNHLFSLEADVPTFTEALAQRGYATGAFVSASVLDRRYGLARGFAVYDDDTGPLERPAADTIAAAERWLASAPRPAFAWIHLFEPHAPYRTGTYDSEVRAVDAALGGFVERLRQSPTWPQTIVSVTADHGESLGEHGEKTHGFFVYDSTLLVPWVTRVPGREPATIPHQARLVDVMPTLAAWAGAAIQGPRGGIDGVSLDAARPDGPSPALEAYSETFLPRHQFGWSELRSLRTDRTKWIAAPRPEAYDLAADPGETRNIAASAADRVRSMERQLAAVERAAVARPARASDPVVAEQLMALGYIAGGATADAACGGADHDCTQRDDPKDKVRVYQLTMDALESSEGGRPAEALAMLRAAERLDPGTAPVPFLRGVVLGNIGRFDEAADALERAVALSPRHVLARFKLALAYVRTDRPDRAERVLEGVLRDEPRNVRALHNLAAIAYTRGQLDRAAALEQQAVALDANYAEAWNTLGAIDILRRQPVRAVTALQRATSLDPRNAQAFRNLAIALRATGDRAAADRAALRACELDRRLCGL